MKYWKGTAGGPKEGQFGTMDDDGTVPDSTEATKAEYDAYIAGIPLGPAPKDYKALFTAAATANDKINVMADMLKLI